MRPWRSATEDHPAPCGHEPIPPRFNEAVAFCHGRRAGRPAVGPRPAASMRPWRSATEDVILPLRLCYPCYASMRPWRSATEDATTTPNPPAPTPCFNEAVAFCHGRRRPGRAAPRAGCRASMRPWRSATEDGDAHRAPGRRGRASMRPWRSATEDTTQPPQWRPRRRFNEAVAFCHGRRRSRLRSCRDRCASMRPWRSATEDPDPPGHGRQPAGASMRPWRSATEDEATRARRTKA